MGARRVMAGCKPLAPTCTIPTSHKVSIFEKKGLGRSVISMGEI